VLATPGVSLGSSNLSLGDSWLVGSSLIQPMDVGQSRLLGRSDEGLDSFDDKTEAAVEEELRIEVFQTANEKDSVKINSEGDANDLLGVNKVVSLMIYELN